MRTEIAPGQTPASFGFDVVMADNLPELNVLQAERRYDADGVRKNMLELCFNKLKSVQRVGSRYDKTAESFLGFIDILSIRLWPRHLST